MNKTKSRINRTNRFRKKMQKNHENLPGDVGLASEVLFERLEARFGAEIGEGDRHGCSVGRQETETLASRREKRIDQSEEGVYIARIFCFCSGPKLRDLSP